MTVLGSGAILIYPGAKTGRFRPADLGGQIPVLEWPMWQAGRFGPMPGQVHHSLQVESEPDRRYGQQRFRHEMRRLCGVADRRLAAVALFAGHAVSIADIAILGRASWHERHAVELAAFPHVRWWDEKMMARPARRRGFEAELR